MITLGEGEHIVEATLQPGQSESLSFDTEVDTLIAVVESEELDGDGLVLTKLDDVPTPENADCVGSAAGDACSYVAPGAAAVNVGMMAPATSTGLTVRLRIRIQPGGADGDDCPPFTACGISTSP